MAKLYTVPGVMTSGQVLEGSIIPPSVGVDDYDARFVPGAELAEVGQAPQQITETVTGTTIPRRYASVDYTVSKHGDRYGLTANRNSGYRGDTALTRKTYGTVFVVVKPSDEVSGAANLVIGGGYTYAKNSGRHQVTVGGETALVPAKTGQVEVVSFHAQGGTTLLETDSGERASLNATVAAATDFAFGTAGYVDAAKGNVLFDIIMYGRILSSEEKETVRKNLLNIWGGR